MSWQREWKTACALCATSMFSGWRRRPVGMSVLLACSLTFRLQAIIARVSPGRSARCSCSTFFFCFCRRYFSPLFRSRSGCFRCGSSSGRGGMCECKQTQTKFNKRLLGLHHCLFVCRLDSTPCPYREYIHRNPSYPLSNIACSVASSMAVPSSDSPCDSNSTNNLFSNAWVSSQRAASCCMR